MLIFNEFYGQQTLWISGENIHDGMYGPIIGRITENKYITDGFYGPIVARIEGNRILEGVNNGNILATIDGNKIYEGMYGKLIGTIGR